MRRSFSFIAFLLLSQQYLHAQLRDSLDITIGMITTMAEKSYQPLWIITNQYGTLSNRQADFATHLRLSNQQVFGNKERLEKEGASSRRKPVCISYGFDIYNNNHFQDFFIKEGFLKISLNDWELRTGRYEEVIGEVDPVLSSGSLGVSSNALPIPQVGIKLTQYKDIPFTNGWLQAKGQFSHGWLGKNNFVKDAYLHQKSIYLKLGKNSLQFYGGLNHFAQWGGRHPQGPTPSRFKDFLRIVILPQLDQFFQLLEKPQGTKP